MPGSSVNVSDANTVLDTAVAKTLKEFADAMEARGDMEFEHAALNWVRKSLQAHKRILFSGDGYSEEWHVEAERRGLCNFATTADALPCFVAEKNLELFSEMGVLSPVEARSRYEVKLEKYNKLMNIEANTMEVMARRTYLPVISAYATKIAKGITTVTAAMPDAPMSHEHRELKTLTEGVNAIYDGSMLCAMPMSRPKRLPIPKSGPTRMPTRCAPRWMPCVLRLTPWSLLSQATIGPFRRTRHAFLLLVWPCG